MAYTIDRPRVTPVSLFDDVTTLTAPEQTRELSQSELAAEMAEKTTGFQFGFSWLGITSTATIADTVKAAEAFGASSEAVKLKKQLIDPKRAEYKACTKIKGAVRKWVDSNSLPYVMPGVRLIPREKIQDFNAKMFGFRAELTEAVNGLNAVYTDMIDDARTRLAELFDAGDYPSTLASCFAINWTFPALAAPDYLAKLSPEVYRAESEKVAARFAAAAEKAESAFTSELDRMVGSMVERLSGGDDGEQKIFHNSLVGNLNEFFERFRSLSIGSSRELNEIVNLAQNAIAGVSAKDLRNSASKRDNVRAQMADIGDKIADMMERKPKRKMRRSPVQQATPTTAA